MGVVAAVLARDLRLAYRQGGETVLAVLFFLLAAALFPFGLGIDPGLLVKVGPGVVWVTALLAALLSLERMFQSDYEDGGLELLVLAPAPLELLVLAKVAAHWLTTGLPLMVATPIVAVLYHLDWPMVAVLEVGLLIGTPVLSLIGALGAALILGARRGGALLILLVAPLALPVLIFGAGAAANVAAGSAPGAALTVEAGLLLAALPLAPWGAAAALRAALE